MVLTAPYFSRHWYDKGEISYLAQYRRLDCFLTSYPHQHTDEFRLFSQNAFAVVTLQKTLMWMKTFNANGVPLIEDILSLVYQENYLRAQLRTAQIRLEVGKEVWYTPSFLFNKFFVKNFCHSL